MHINISKFLVEAAFSLPWLCFWDELTLYFENFYASFLIMWMTFSGLYIRKTKLLFLYYFIHQLWAKQKYFFKLPRYRFIHPAEGKLKALFSKLEKLQMNLRDSISFRDKNLYFCRLNTKNCLLRWYKIQG